MLLDVQNLSKSFGALRVANNVTLQLEPGEALGIIGPNGAGKSSLFNLIAGTVRADAGLIRLGGRDVTNAGAATRCRLGIGRSYQIPRPWAGLTVYENLLVGAQFGAGKNAADAHCSCIETLELVELSHVADTPAGRLRLLDRKRLELARGLATDPKVLLLDEIAGGLTDLECDSLINAIRTIRSSGVGIIWIEHIVHALLAVVDRLAVLSAGTLIANGEPHAVFNSRDVQDLYMGTPA